LTVEYEDYENASFTSQSPRVDDPMSTEQMLDTLRGLVKEVHAAKSGRTVAIQAVAAVHVFHIMDCLMSAGHPLPEAWKVAR
jgi:hypothetical protein